MFEFLAEFKARTQRGLRIVVAADDCFRVANELIFQLDEQRAPLILRPRPVGMLLAAVPTHHADAEAPSVRRSVGASNLNATTVEARPVVLDDPVVSDAELEAGDVPTAHRLPVRRSRVGR